MVKRSIFIVYSPEDGIAFSDQLSAALQRQSYELAPTLESAFVCLLLITPMWTQCADCLTHYQTAAESAKPTIALYRGDSATAKQWLAQAQVALVVDFANTFDKGFAELCEALESMRWVQAPLATSTDPDVDLLGKLAPDFATVEDAHLSTVSSAFANLFDAGMPNIAQYLTDAIGPSSSAVSKSAEDNTQANMDSQTTTQKPALPSSKDAEYYLRYIESRERRQSTVEQDKQRQREQYYDAVKMIPVFDLPDKSPKFQCDIFVIMPFAEEFKPIFDMIESLAKDMGLVAKRGDSWNFSKKNIMHEVWSALCASRIVIADCSGLNANVFYELGIAHMLGRETILITRDIEKAAFDTRDRRHIVYENTIGGGERLRQALTATITEILDDFV